MATLKEEGIAFATKGGGGAASRVSSSSSSPSSSSSLLLPPLLPFSDILGAEALPRNRPSSSSSPFSFLRNCAASSSCSPHREPWLVRVHTVSKGSKLGDWRPRTISLLAPSARAARAWAASISSSAAASHAGRPRALLVLLNPYGGARGAARGVWRRVAQPLLEGAAGIACDVVETDSAGHAERVVRSLSLDRLRSLDGVVVVGGDGLFQEALNGLLAIRFGDGDGGDSATASSSSSSSSSPTAAAPPPPSSSPSFCPLRALEASRLRLGHVPAGSTDALAWSIHGTRCPAAAALHVALGDGARLDVLALGPVVARGGRSAAAAASSSSTSPSVPLPRPLEEEEEEEDEDDDGGDDAAGRSPLTPRGAATSSGGGFSSRATTAAAPPVPTPPPCSPPPSSSSTTTEEECWPPRAAACMASCGYFGDLLALSEKMRWLGPARYGVAGFLTLATLKKYELRIRYLPADDAENAENDGGAGEIGPATPRTPNAGPLLPGAVGRAFCRPATAAAPPPLDASSSSLVSPPPPSSSLAEGGSSSSDGSGWKTDEGPFSAVLLACLPCRSDRSASGIAPDRAMADGLASLVRVRACSRLRFLRFLVAVSRDGARVVEEAAAAVRKEKTADATEQEEDQEGSKGKKKKKTKKRKGAAALPWVSVVAVRAVVVEPLSSPSPSSSSSSSPSSYLPWNADGETLPPSGVAAVVRKGLVRVFARPQLADDDE